MYLPLIAIETQLPQPPAHLTHVPLFHLWREGGREEGGEGGGEGGREGGRGGMERGRGTEGGREGEEGSNDDKVQSE